MCTNGRVESESQHSFTLGVFVSSSINPYRRETSEFAIRVMLVQSSTLLKLFNTWPAHLNFLSLFASASFQWTIHNTQINHNCWFIVAVLNCFLKRGQFKPETRSLSFFLSVFIWMDNSWRKRYPLSQIIYYFYEKEIVPFPCDCVFYVIMLIACFFFSSMISNFFSP